MQEHCSESQIDHEITNEIEARAQKLQLAKEILGFNYPNTFRRSHQNVQIQTAYLSHSREELVEISEQFAVCGRISALRRMGKLIFLKLQDASGFLQILLSPAQLEQKAFENLGQILDLGDVIGVNGRLCRTQRGELSLQAFRVELLTKALRPLAEKYHGVVDPEIRQRKRYLELLSHPESRHRFILRSKIIQSVRNYLCTQDFLEVETPMMHPLAGGAAARPFMTHHHALHQEFYLRIAPELYLKRLIVGGFEKVFELNRNFRNEGISSRHNPEFTMLEFYQAYVGFEEMIQHVEALLRYVVQEVFQTTHLTIGDRPIDFSRPFRRWTLQQALVATVSQAPREVWSSVEDLKALCHQYQIKSNEFWGVGEYQFALFEHLVEPTLIEPTFIMGYPASVSPLARRCDKNPEEAERFELFAAGRELANGFSELNDPKKQAQIFHAQEKNKEAGDDEAMHFDHDYIEALECALAPTGGVGIGMDRLVMWLTQCENIREIILFPTLKRKR